MKLFQFLSRKIITPTALIYTLLTFVLHFLLLLMDSPKPAITLHTATTFLVLSLLISLCNLLFSLRQFSMLTRVLLHFPAVLVSIVGVLLLDGGYDLTVNSLVLVIVYTVLYAVIVPPVLLIGNKVHQTKTEEKTYTSIFSPRD